MPTGDEGDDELEGLMQAVPVPLEKKGNAGFFSNREAAIAGGRKGGPAAAEANRRRKEMKETIEMMLDLGVNENTRESLRQMGIENPDDYTVQTAIIVAQGLKAMKGDTKAAQFIMEYGGYDPKLLLEIEKVRIAREAAQPQEVQEDNYTHIYMPALDEEPEETPPKDKKEEGEK